MKKTACIVLCACLTASLCFLFACNKEKQYKRTEIGVFDTHTVILGYEESEELFEKRADEITEKLRYYHELFDIYYEYDGVNSLKTVNDKAGEEAVAVEKPVIDLLGYSKDVYVLTEGRTNIAMGSVLSIWHDYREKGINDPASAVLPPMEDLQRAAENTNIEKLIIDDENGTVFLANEKMSLDVGAVAKGYSVEMTARYCEEMGYTGYALSVGGNVRCIGAKPDGEKWEIGVQNPDTKSENPYVAKVYLENESLVTSGVYQRFYTVAEKQYHHIIDPKTLMPSDRYASVSVISRDSGLADALSTALFNVTEEEGKAIAEKANAEVLWVYPDGTLKMTDGFRRYTEK